MRILIVGRTGQIATELLARLPQAVALEPPELDLTDAASIAVAFAAHRPEAVINAAAYTAVDRAEDDRALAFAVNATGPRLLGEAAAIAVLPRLVATPAGDPCFGVFHLTGAPYTTWFDFAAAILDGAARRGQKRPRLVPITTADYPTKAQRPANSRLDCSRAQDVLGLSPADWRDGLEACLTALMGDASP